MTTGQLVFRETGATAPDGRAIMMVAGLLAFDNPPKGEHQYNVVGNEEILTMEHHRDLTEEIRGQKLGDTLTSEIWRV